MRTVSTFEPPPVFSIEVTAGRDGHGVVVAVAGELDVTTAPAVESMLRAQLAAGAVLLDLKRLSFMDSSGIRLLDAVLRDMRPMGWTLLIVPALQPPVRRIIELTGMTNSLPFDEDSGVQQGS